MIVVLRDAAKVGLPAKLFLGNVYNISPAIPQQLGQSVEGFRAIQVYSNYGSDIPAMKDIDAFKSKNDVMHVPPQQATEESLHKVYLN